jgi:hypothetical protein
VHGLARTDTQQDSQNFQIGHVLGERGIQAGAALLDERKMKSRREGDSLEQIRESRLGWIRVDDTSSRVVIAPRDSGVRRPLAFKGWPAVTPFESAVAALSVKEAVCASISVTGLFRIFILVRSDLS